MFRKDGLGEMLNVGGGGSTTVMLRGTICVRVPLVAVSVTK